MSDDNRRMFEGSVHRIPGQSSLACDVYKLNQAIVLP
jgi:hypothetical protein